jgi:hypothetical protein
MMKKILLLVLFSFFLVDTYAQVSADSLAYQAQRKKINDMLGQRKIKFGQYDQSLNEHTGIFGLQTKKDIRRSNDILMDIVKTDNDIYKQLKILLDYRAFQQTQVQDHSKETESTNLGFMTAINNLQRANDKLRKEADDAAKSSEATKRNFIIVIVLMAASILWLLRRKYAVRS